MLDAYRALFALPGSRAFALAGLVARLPLPMTGIGIITLLAQRYGSYALAGAVSATFVLSYALLSPQVSRRVDRHGQRRVLPLASAACIAGLLLVLVCAWRDAPVWTLFIGAGLAGCMPSMSAMVRARWTAHYRGQPQLQTAYSLETVVDELTFIAGPPLSIGLAVALFPQAGLLAAALLLALGVTALVGQRATEPAPVAPDPQAGGARPVLAAPGMRWLALLMAAMGVIVGTVDIVSVAFAGAQGRPGAASLVLAAYALGSCVAGLVFGALRLQTPLHRLLWWGAIATAASTVPLTQAATIAPLAGAVLLAGLAFAPTLIVAMSLVERLVPDRNLTEGMSWLLAGLNVGVAAGAALAGQVVDLYGARAGFAVALGGAAAVIALAWLAQHRLRAQPAGMAQA
ncbi:MFS transporter [Bordetella genomosp. 1]|uniref:MFS transporter n=1 Tax=Bordetella genomosp. 1 TaxID=1395607 RepID=A0A261SIR0_9BORD|nr:MFS transporter [Bordetella genomosp. 1]OZI36223.1 MFS transporter [Bordetella genomosp. 1]